MKKTFVDTSLLIAIARGERDVSEKALDIIDDSDRVFVSSVYVKLETLPKPTWHGFEEQVKVYEEIFSDVSQWVPSSPELSQRAFELGCEYGLGAVDALNVAAAERAEAELVTAENPTKPMLRVSSITAVSIRE